MAAAELAPPSAMLDTADRAGQYFVRLISVANQSGPLIERAPGRSERPEPAAVDAELAGRLRLAVTRLARQLRQQAPSGLSPSLLSALASINHHGPLTHGELAELEQVAPPTITRCVDRLVEQGLVDRVVDLDDRRVSRVTMLPAGDELIASIRTRKEAWLIERLAELPDDQPHLANTVAVLEHLLETR